jgi:hypothetical protein
MKGQLQQQQEQHLNALSIRNSHWKLPLIEELDTNCKKDEARKAPVPCSSLPPSIKVKSSSSPRPTKLYKIPQIPIRINQ